MRAMGKTADLDDRPKPGLTGRYLNHAHTRIRAGAGRRNVEERSRGHRRRAPYLGEDAGHVEDIRREDAERLSQLKR
jgi:hypothetical protein